MNEKDFPIDKHGSSRIDFWCLITGFIAKQIIDLIGRYICFYRKHFGCNHSQRLITFFVKLVFPVLESCLCNTLNTDRKVNPFIIHFYVLVKSRFVDLFLSILSSSITGFIPFTLFLFI